MMRIIDILGNPELKNKHVLKMLMMYHTDLIKEDFITKLDDEFAQDIFDIVLKDYYRYVNDKEPLEYIMGYVEFKQRRFFVDRNTMIPRPETEYMIEAIAEELAGLQNTKEGRQLIVDVGTGSGVLGLSAYLSKEDWADQLILCDFYPECLITAKKNMLALLNVDQQKNVEFVESNLLQHVVDKDLITKDNSLVITANLPYIPTETFDEQAEENVHLWEPRYAFISGEDGLDLYREMFGQIKGKSAKYFVMYLEMMTWQVDVLRKEFEWLDFEEVKTFHFQIRIVKATFK